MIDILFGLPGRWPLSFRVLVIGDVLAGSLPHFESFTLMALRYFGIKLYKCKMFHRSFSETNTSYPPFNLNKNHILSGNETSFVSLFCLGHKPL